MNTVPDNQASQSNGQSHRTRHNPRIASIDQFKGVLVLLMIVYHATHFLDMRSQEGTADLIRHQLVFLHSAFLFVAGFLCGYAYAHRPNTSFVQSRLFFRGVRLFIVFVVCNLFAYVVLSDYRFADLASQFDSIDNFVQNFALGISGRLFAFEVLAYIAIYLCLASFATRPLRLSAAMILLAACSICVNSPTVRFLLIGTIGQSLGTAWAARPSLIHPRVLSIVGARSTAAVVFGVSVLMRLMNEWESALTGESNVYRWSEPLVLAFEALAWWSVSPVFCSILPVQLSRAVVFLGQYSLLAYLFQMPLIRVVAKLWPPLFESHVVVNYCFVVLTATLLVIAFLWIVDTLRRRFASLDRVYRSTFS